MDSVIQEAEVNYTAASSSGTTFSSGNNDVDFLLQVEPQIKKLVEISAGLSNEATDDDDGLISTFAPQAADIANKIIDAYNHVVTEDKEVSPVVQSVITAAGAYIATVDGKMTKSERNKLVEAAYDLMGETTKGILPKDKLKVVTGKFGLIDIGTALLKASYMSDKNIHGESAGSFPVEFYKAYIGGTIDSIKEDWRTKSLVWAGKNLKYFAELHGLDGIASSIGIIEQLAEKLPTAALDNDLVNGFLNLISEIDPKLGCSLRMAQYDLLKSFGYFSMNPKKIVDEEEKVIRRLGPKVKIINESLSGAILISGDGDDTIQSGKHVSEYVEDTLTNDVKIYAGDGDNDILVVGNRAVIYAGTGKDVITAKGDNSKIYAGSGDNIVHAGENGVVYVDDGKNTAR